MSDSYMLGVFAGIIVAIVVLGIIRKTTRCQRAEYDERQIAAQGKCYKAAFFTMVVVSALFALLDVMGIGLFTVTVSTFTSILVSTAVFAIYAILLDCYYGINQNPRSTIIMGIALSLMSFIPAVRFLQEGQFFEGGTFGNGFTSLLCSVVWLVVIVVTVVHNRKAGEGEDEE